MPAMRTDLPPVKVDAPGINGFPVGPQDIFAAGGAGDDIRFRTHVCVIDGRFARYEQAKGATGRGSRMERRDRFAPQNRPERNPAERPRSDVRVRRVNRDAGCNAAERPHGRMRDRPGADISSATRAGERRRPSVYRQADGNDERAAQRRPSLIHSPAVFFA